MQFCSITHKYTTVSIITHKLLNNTFFKNVIKYKNSYYYIALTLLKKKKRNNSEADIKKLTIICIIRI